MGKPSMYPPGPITQQCEVGREWFRRIFKPHARQVSQPTYLKTIALVLGDTVFHSSQYSGLCMGTLKEPTPKVFLALGLFNEALAAGKIPAEVSHKWVDPKPMVNPTTGKPLNAAELFLIFVGQLDLGLPEVDEIPQEKEHEVSRIFGKFVRTSLASKGVDFVVEDHQRLLAVAPSFKGLLSGKEVRGEVLVDDLPAIAQELGLQVKELWDVITPVITEDTP